MLIVFTLAFASILSYAQEDLYSIDSKGESLEIVLANMEKNNGLFFSYVTEDVSGKIVNISIEESSLEETLHSLLSPFYLGYTLSEEKYVLIFNRKTVAHDQLICGTVKDGDSGSPLEFANVFLLSTNQGSATEIDGKFTFNVHSTLLDTLVISYVGYNTVYLTLEDFYGKECVEINMVLPRNLEPFVIVTGYLSEGIHLEDNGLATSINMNALVSPPGAIDNNPLSVAQSLPGISSPTSKASDIFIRGTTPDQTLISWEGIPVYHTAHYFGMISAINPLLVDEMKIYRGGFGAEFGGRVGGMLQLSTDTIKSTNKYGAGISMTEVFGFWRKKFANVKNLNIGLSMRSSFQNLYTTPTYDKISSFNQQILLLGKKDLTDLPPHIDIEKDFGFVDGNIKASFSPTKDDVISISGLYSENNYYSQTRDRRRDEVQPDTLDFSNYGFEHQLGKKLEPTNII